MRTRCPVSLAVESTRWVAYDQEQPLLALGTPDITSNAPSKYDLFRSSPSGTTKVAVGLAVARIDSFATQGHVRTAVASVRGASEPHTGPKFAISEIDDYFST